MKKFVKLCLQLSYIVQNSFHFDEIFHMNSKFQFLYSILSIYKTLLDRVCYSMHKRTLSTLVKLLGVRLPRRMRDFSSPPARFTVCIVTRFAGHTIRKVKFLSKNSILTKPQHFHKFFTQIFFGNFSREIKVVNS